MATLTLALLGPVEIALAGKTLVFEYNKVRALLIYLALEAAHAHTRSSLASLLWPDMPERAARQNLSQALTSLRQTLGDRAKTATGNFVLAAGDSVQLNPAAGLVVDVASFLATLNACDAHAHRNWRTCATCPERLRQAISLYRGDFLAHFFLHDSQPFEEWALLQREHLRQRALSALERLAQAAEWRGAYAQAVAYARRQLDLEPLLEASHRELMRLLALGCESSAALAQYDQLRRTLAQELDAAPEAETTALRDRIRASTAGSGDDFRRFQAPPVRLPGETTPLVGRAREVEAVCERLHDGVRALTLSGPPGIGKTRLAMEVARQLRFNFEDGAHWVELAPLAGPALVPAAIAYALGVKESAGQAIETALCEQLRRKHMLLALDNFEHVLDGAPFVAALLGACPGVQVLVTSRAPLRIRAEKQFPLEPLALPETSDLDAIARAPAVQLLVERARAVRPSFVLDRQNAPALAAICARLDGLPLALELIAARLALHPEPAELLRQLENRLVMLADGPRDLPKRQQTLRGAIRWSFDLLTTEAQQAFCQLGVCVGGFTPEAAQAIAGGTTPMADVLATLQQHSLLQQQAVDGETRFTLLETIREFALEQLAAWAELDAAQRRHAQYFLALAESAQAELDSPGSAHWLDRLEREHDNLRAALAYAQALPDDSALRLASALGTFWEVRGYLAEGKRWLAQSLGAHPDAAPRLRAESLDKMSVLVYRQGQYAEAQDINAQSLAFWQRLEDSPAIARTLRRMGSVALDLGELAQARAYCEQCLAIARANNDARTIALVLNTLGLLTEQAGDQAGARAIYEECLPIFETLNDKKGVGLVLNNLGIAVWHQGDHAAGHAVLAQSLTAFREIGYKWGEALALLNLGNVEVQQVDVAAAQVHYEQSLALYRELGDRASGSYPLFGLGDVAWQQGDHARASALYREALALRYETGEKLPMPRNLEGIGQVARVAGQPERAVRLFGAAEALRESLRGKLTVDYLPEYERETSALRAALPAAAFTQAWCEGRALSLEQAVSFALSHQ